MEDALLETVARQGGNLIRLISPGLWMAARERFFSLSGRSERELALLDVLVPRDRLAVDVGANRGTYTYPLTKLASRVIAFEPIPDLAADLRALFGTNVDIQPVALSDRNGEATLRVPMWGARLATGLATIESGNALNGTEFREIVVRTARLDDLNLSNVGFIKIDVEGHEASVLAGAAGTISRDRPVLLIEIEERHRHNAVQETTEMLAAAGYCGFFIQKERVLPVDEFNVAQDQDPAVLESRPRTSTETRYINNFIYVDRRDGPELCHRLEDRLTVRLGRALR